MVKLTKTLRKTGGAKKLKTGNPERKSFNFNEFTKSFRSLDQNNYGSWPLPVKVTLLLFIVGIVAALAYALPISSKIEEITAAENEEKTLLDQYRTKESKARHLNEYKAQIATMELDFKELLNQLPKDTRISDLVQGINAVGINSNVRFQDISVEPEVTKDFFIEQPIRIATVGNYHQFGSFLSGLAKLPRIITMHNFEVNNTKPTLDELPELTMVLNAKTYRSKEINPADLKKAASGTAGTKPASTTATTTGAK